MTKTYRHLWDQISSFEALHAAYLKARRGKRYEDEALRFGANLEIELLRLRDELAGGTYRTSEYRRFEVYEPKKREVAALPFRDRVVQHALVAVLEAIYEPRFIHDSYACRVGRGTHAGVDRLTEFLRRANRDWAQTYILKADVSKFFPSVDHERLKVVLRRYIACPQTVRLCEEIIDSWNAETGKGIPIGNLTSQLFANVYLHELDEYVKQTLRWPMYIRYMDDTVFLGFDKVILGALRKTLGEFLENKLLLRLNPKTAIFPAEQGVDFLGYRTWRTHRLLRKRNVVDTRRRMKALARRYGAGEIEAKRVRASLMAWLGHAGHANTYTLQRQLLHNLVLRRT